MSIKWCLVRFYFACKKSYQQGVFRSKTDVKLRGITLHDDIKK